MRNGIIRFASLYAFNVVMLLVIGMILPRVQVGLHALWAAIVLTLAALFVKPTLRRLFTRTANAASTRAGGGEKLLQYLVVYAVEFVIWLLTVWLSGVSAHGILFGFLFPPLLLLVGWVVYDLVDDRIHAKAGEVYDSVAQRTDRSGGRPAGDPAAGATPPPTTTRPPASARPDDGLTPEQRRMLDEL